MISCYFVFGSGQPSSVISALVRDRIRKKALDNINKKNTFDMIDARALTARQQEDYKKW